MKKYGLFIEDPSFVEYTKKFDKLFKQAVDITHINPHVTCSVMSISEKCNATAIIRSPNAKYDKCLQLIKNNIAMVLKQIAKLFQAVGNADNKSAWYSELANRYFLTDMEYLFLILHRPTIDYYTENPTFNIVELVDAQNEINVSEVLEHIHNIQINVQYRCSDGYGYRERHSDTVTMCNYEIIAIRTIIDNIVHNDYIMFNTDRYKDADIENISSVKHVQKIKSGVVYDTIDYCDKWDVDQLADSFDNICISDLTIDGCSLNETTHSQLADDPIFSPLLRTIEFRTNALAKAIPKLSYAKMASIALSLGISNYQNGKKLKKTQLYDYIHAIPMY